ncbi:MAG TPA: phosphate signaling complex protein PhoU [Rectinemataceae bacterium]
MSTRMAYQEEMDRLRHDVLTMGARVEESIGKALTALKSQDVQLAKEVKADDAVVDALQLEIEDQTAILIATQQPVARDLRELVTIFKVTYNLERAGDYAVHLAKTAKKLAGEPPFRQTDRLERMATVGMEMLRLSVNAYMDWDAAAAQAAAAMDDAIDGEHKALVEETLGMMREQPDIVQRAARLLTTSGYLERFGDHVTNICEAVVYMVEGRHAELNRGSAP